jgi:hypothetical protein
LSPINRLPVLVPPAVGVKVTLRVQLPPTGTLVPQSFVWAKSPVTVSFKMVSAPVPVLESVTFSAALVLPIF